MKRYSLANYTVSIEPLDSILQSTFGVMTVGGQGNYMETIRLSTENNLWSTVGYATGAWVHNKNLAKNGQAELVLQQVSDDVAKFKKLCELYYTGDYQGFTMTLTNNNGEQIATAVSCYPVKIPTQEFGATSANQTWQFTCGEITFN